MTPNRDRSNLGPQIDTGTGSPVTDRPEAWAPQGPDIPANDTGIGSTPARRLDTLDSGSTFIPPRWM